MISSAADAKYLANATIYPSALLRQAFDKPVEEKFFSLNKYKDEEFLTMGAGNCKVVEDFIAKMTQIVGDDTKMDAFYLEERLVKQALISLKSLNNPDTELKGLGAQIVRLSKEAKKLKQELTKVEKEKEDPTKLAEIKKKLEKADVKLNAAKKEENDLQKKLGWVKPPELVALEKYETAIDQAVVVIKEFFTYKGNSSRIDAFVKKYPFWN